VSGRTAGGRAVARGVQNVAAFAAFAAFAVLREFERSRCSVRSVRQEVFGGKCSK
jgi:hypothetical protein